MGYSPEQLHGEMGVPLRTLEGSGCRRHGEWFLLLAVPLFVYEGPCLRASLPKRRVESPPEPSSSLFWPHASQTDPGSQGSPPALPGFSWCIRLRGRTGRWGGGREEVRGLPGRVKEVAENEEAPRSGRQRRLRRREERGGAGDPRCSSTASRSRPQRAGIPAPRPRTAPPPPHLRR